MAIEITVPRLGWNMEEGVFVGWLKQDGDPVRAGESLFTLEGEKATEDIECLDSGILHISPRAPKPGDKVAVGAVIGYLVGPDENAGEVSASTSGWPGLEPSEAPDYAKPGLPKTPAPATHRRASHKSSTPMKAASPRARRVARELGIDWTKLAGTGRSGRVRECDIRAAAQTPEYKAVDIKRAIPLTSIRQTIAARMLTSAHSTVPVTLTTTADATNLVNLRSQFKTAPEVVPGYTDFFAKLAVVALAEHPMLNATWADDQIIVNTDIHIGIAVDTEIGLMVPVVRDVPRLGLRQFATKSRELAERARQGKLRAEEMHGGTFAITNLGSYGIDAFTPIINLPQCAILGVGRIQRVPVVSGHAVAIRDQVTLSLTFDHRIVDGAPAARFLQTLVRLVENPGPALVA
jgi:pyruvate dehydrogenase E2 component (dihydrolipoamide acetyltransferase)